MSHPPSRRRHSTKSPSGSFHQPASFPRSNPANQRQPLLPLDPPKPIDPLPPRSPRRPGRRAPPERLRLTSSPAGLVGDHPCQADLASISLSLPLISLSLSSTSPHGLSFFRTNKGLAMATGWSSAAMDPRLRAPDSAPPLDSVIQVRSSSALP